MMDEGNNVVTMRIKDSKGEPTPPETDFKKRAKRMFSIDRWNGSPGLDHWGFGEPGAEEVECNMIQGASEGVIFPPALRPEKQFVVYRKPFCRTLPLRYVRTGPTPPPHKLPAFWYSLGEEAFERAEVNPDNSCYCRPEIAPCLPRGLGDLTPCYYGIPAAVSKPHFLDSDPSLLLHVDGLNPNETLHGTSLAIQPRVGVPLRANIRVQTNLVMHYTRGIPRTQKFNNMTLPIFWLDLTMEGLPPWMDTLLQLLLVIAPAAITVLLTTLSAAGMALLMVATAAALLRFSSEKQRSLRPPTASVISVASAAAAAAVGKMEPLLPRPPTPPLLHEGKGWD